MTTTRPGPCRCNAPGVTVGRCPSCGLVVSVAVDTETVWNRPDWCGHTGVIHWTWYPTKPLPTQRERGPASANKT